MMWKNCAALVVNELYTDFNTTVAELLSLHESLEATDCLLSTDFFLTDSSVLIVIVHFSAESVPLTLLRNAMTSDTSTCLRILDLSVLSEPQMESFHAKRLQNVAWQKREMQDWPETIAAVRTQLFPLAQTDEAGTSGRIQLDLEVVVVAGGQEYPGRLTTISPREAIIHCTRRPSVGEKVTLSLPTSRSEWRLIIDARVCSHIGVSGTEVSGSGAFEVGLLLDDNNRVLFESFLNAQTRCVPWPGPSGRRFERFPIRLAVTYHGLQGQESVVNLSRGGAFIESKNPPALNTELDMRLSLTGKTETVGLRGRVVHIGEASGGRPGGVGVEFIDSPEKVAEAIRRLLGRNKMPSDRRILIVDDDRFFREVIGGAFRVAGYEVLQAPDGVHALQVLVEELLRLDVVALDLFMPGITGVEVIEKIRRVGGERDLVLVVLTGAELTEEDVKNLKDFGANDVFPKQIDPEELTGRVNALVAAQWATLSEQAIDGLLG